jgi:hypothetical protein
MYQPFHRLRVRFAEMELRQGDVAQAAGMAKSTMTARMKATSLDERRDHPRGRCFEHSPGADRRVFL